MKAATCVLSVCLSLFAQQPPVHSITCVVAPVPRKSPLFISLIDSSGFGRGDRHVRDTILQAPHPDTVRVVLDGIPPGVYGFRIFMDKNENKKLDFGMFGPKEPWALSYRKKPKIPGPPQFDDFSFSLGADTTIFLEINGK